MAEQRGLVFLCVLLKLAQQHGCEISHDGGCHEITIHGVLIQFYLYERSVRRRVPLTKKEMKSSRFDERTKQDGKIDYRASGWLVLAFKVGKSNEYRIAERARRSEGFHNS